MFNKKTKRAKVDLPKDNSENTKEEPEVSSVIEEKKSEEQVPKEEKEMSENKEIDELGRLTEFEKKELINLENYPKEIQSSSATNEYLVRYPFVAKEKDELSLIVGETIHVTDTSDEIWWKGWKNDSRGIVEGMFLSNYVLIRENDSYEKETQIDNPIKIFQDFQQTKLLYQTLEQKCQKQEKSKQAELNLSTP